MARSEADLVRLLADVSAAGLGERSWEDALGKLSTFFESAGAAIFDVDRRTAFVPAIHTFGLGETKGDYADRMNAINPRMLRALDQPGCHTASDYDVLSEEDIRRSEFYDWLGREVGVKYHVGSRMIDAGPVSSFVSIEFAPGHGHAEPDEIELLSLVSRHIANAWRFWRGFAAFAAAQGIREILEESVPWGVFGLDRTGKVLSTNRRARSIVARADGLTIRKGLLCAVRAAENRSLNLILAEALRTADGEGTGPGGVLAIARRDGGPPYVLRILPVGHSAERAAGAVAVLAVVSDPDFGLPEADDLRTIFGLTEREAGLALLIAGGWSLKQAAIRTGIAHNTARVHLASIMAKTGTHSQAALASLLRSLPASVNGYAAQ